MLASAKNFVKSLLKRSPVALTQNHRYDLQTKQILRRVLRPNSNCIDIGCHRGEILDLMVEYAPQGQHTGFEPIPVMAADLKVRYADNRNIRIRPLALSNAAGFANFNYVTSNPAYSGLRKRDYDRAGETDVAIKVETARLDDEIPAGKRIDLIKLDVEGGELQVFEGATRLLAEQRPVVVFEHGLGASEHYGSTPSQVYEVLAKAGLRISTLGDFLAERPALTLRAFAEQYHRKLNYYFVAHR